MRLSGEASFETKDKVIHWLMVIQWPVHDCMEKSELEIVLYSLTVSTTSTPMLSKTAGDETKFVLIINQPRLFSMLSSLGMTTCCFNGWLWACNIVGVASFLWYSYLIFL
jgi:hypothetical protein